MHQYAISVTEVQSFLLAKHPQQQGARVDGYFRMLFSDLAFFLSDPPFCYVTRPAPKNEDEMMVAIFEYIDR